MLFLLVLCGRFAAGGKGKREEERRKGRRWRGKSALVVWGNGAMVVVQIDTPVWAVPSKHAYIFNSII